MSVPTEVIEAAMRPEHTEPPIVPAEKPASDTSSDKAVLGCRAFNHCNGLEYQLKHARADLLGMKEKLTEADELIASYESQLATKSVTVELTRVEDRVKAAERIDRIQRANLDWLSEENFRLRRLLNTNGYDMLAVEALVEKINDHSPRDWESGDVVQCDDHSVWVRLTIWGEQRWRNVVTSHVAEPTDAVFELKHPRLIRHAA